MNANASERGCYCDVWEKDPAPYEARGIPRGFCGLCERCRAPGHSRQHPGPMAYTGSWCDPCFKRLRWTWPFRHPVVWFFLWIPALLVILSRMIP